MSSHVGAYYDDAGNLIKIVRPHFDEPDRKLTVDDFATHEEPGKTRVIITTADFLASPPISLNGTAVFHALNKVALPLLQADQARAKLATLVQGKIAAIDAQLTAIATAQATAEAAAALEPASQDPAL
jgi:hypothetical protein